VTGFSLEGWNIGDAERMEWGPWGSGSDARAKVLADGDGYYLAIVEAGAGYRGDPHEHAHTEFLYVLSGTLQSQGQVLGAGSAYVAAAGSTHDQFASTDGATYLSIFKL
jgi:uncharacterized protein